MELPSNTDVNDILQGQHEIAAHGELLRYVELGTVRGECQCGLCIDKGDRPDPTGHTADVHFFKVALKDIVYDDGDVWLKQSLGEFVRLTKDHKGCDPFDGNEHSFIEIGAWLGDQGLALQYMAMGALLGAFELLTPRRVVPDMSKELQDRFAAQGLVSVVNKATFDPERHMIPAPLQNLLARFLEGPGGC